MRWLQDARAALGREINIESAQNEPDISAGYDSATWTAAQLNAFVTGYLKPAMQTAGLTTKLMAPEPAVYGGTSYFASNRATPLPGNPAMKAAIDILSIPAPSIVTLIG